MTRIHVLSRPEQTGLWVWRDTRRGEEHGPQYEALDRGSDARGLREFEALLDHQLHEPAHVKVHGKGGWDRDEHIKTLPRTDEYRFPEHLWCAEGAARVLAEDPFANGPVQKVRIHLLTGARYRSGSLLLWRPDTQGHTLTGHTEDQDGLHFEVDLVGKEQWLFLFKFIAADGTPEPEHANHLWSARDGNDVWVHSDGAGVSSQMPVRRPLIVRTRAFTQPPSRPLMRVWQADSDFTDDVAGVPEANGWIRFERLIYSDLPYGFMFRDDANEPRWEDEEARRNVLLDQNGDAFTLTGQGERRALGSQGVWTLEGDHELYGGEPAPDKKVSVGVPWRDPACTLRDPLELDVWINHARQPHSVGLLPDTNGRWHFTTYADVVTSFRFRSGTTVEPVDRHTIKIDASAAGATELFVVLGRAEPLRTSPASDPFLDPPFPLVRPGAWLEDGQVRFAVHCPAASIVEVIGEWTEWERHPVELHSTRDGSYWWGQLPQQTIQTALGRDSLHGVMYKFRLNQLRLVQDPAADWVENSAPGSASKLVDHGAYRWRSAAWERPGWEYLTVYQAHPNAFAENGRRGFDAVTHELTAEGGYLRSLKATALLLMPVAEYAMENGWGYNPAFFYAVESSYGGPDALKRLVDACHERGLAVLVDVVFNHAGTGDNVLWAVAPGTYFKGDTEWGAMINFEQPQAIHFFEQNLVHFMRHYRIDGFRFDFTHVIRYGYTRTDHVRVPGSAGGEEFLRKLKRAVRGVDARCLLMAEEFPNDLGFTGRDAPMDTQWHDAFHDRLLDASRGWDVMGPLADALKTPRGGGDDWYEMTNYPESHDEVGNSGDRICAVAGPGRGYRRNKVAAAATLLARGIPMWFMGTEYGEYRQFSKDGSGPIELHIDEEKDDRGHVRRWWNRLCELRRGNSRVQGPAPIGVQYAQDRMLAFTRGDNADLFVLLNFGDWSGYRPLAELNLPEGEYKELLNSTWGEYQVGSEGEQERSNGGWDAHLQRGHSLNIPPCGAVVLERR